VAFFELAFAQLHRVPYFLSCCIRSLTTETTGIKIKLMYGTTMRFIYGCRHLWFIYNTTYITSILGSNFNQYQLRTRHLSTHNTAKGSWVLHCHVVPSIHSIRRSGGRNLFSVPWSHQYSLSSRIKNHKLFPFS
jgi:hypothetical protein